MEKYIIYKEGSDCDGTYVEQCIAGTYDDQEEARSALKSMTEGSDGVSYWLEDQSEESAERID